MPTSLSLNGSGSIRSEGKNDSPTCIPLRSAQGLDLEALEIAWLSRLGLGIYLTWDILPSNSVGLGKKKPGSVKRSAVGTFVRYVASVTTLYVLADHG